MDQCVASGVKHHSFENVRGKHMQGNYVVEPIVARLLNRSLSKQPGSRWQMDVAIAVQLVALQLVALCSAICLSSVCGAGLFAAEQQASGTETPSEKSPEGEQPQPVYARPYLLKLSGPILPFTHQVFKRNLARAKRAGADLLVVEIDSPGGTVEDSLAIAKQLSEVSWAHTVAFIPDHALSGAALASLGCDEIIMAPTARIGDAGVIFLDEDYYFKYTTEKIRSDVVELAKIIARSKQRSVELVEAMIDMDVVVFQKTDAQGNIEFTTRRAKPLENDDPPAIPREALDLKVWKMVPESDEKKFLVLSGERALQLGLAQRQAKNQNELREQFQLQQPFVVLKRTTADTVAYVLNWPLMTVLLLTVGVIALLFELSAPGISVGGILSTLCFVLFFWSKFLAGTAGGLELILFALGIIFLALEVFVIPGFGVPGLLGLVLIVSSLVLASQDFVVPTSSRQLNVFTTGILSMLGVGLFSMVGGAFLAKYLGRVPILSGLVLDPPSSDGPTGLPKESSGKAKTELRKADHLPQIGSWGVAESVLHPSGKANFNGETYDVVADGFVEEGVEVRISEISGNVIRVTAEA
jgi:membrane-bound serine protease (ClpP class)